MVLRIEVEVLLKKCIRVLSIGLLASILKRKGPFDRKYEK
jgi:hypothetical protein